MSEWLWTIGLHPTKVTEFSQLFLAEEVDQRSLEMMTLEQLQTMGVGPAGPRTLAFNAAQRGTCIII